MKKLIVLLAVSLMLAGVANAQNIVSSDRTLDKQIPNWRIAIHGGFSYQLGRVDKSQGSDIAKYVEDLKKGFCYGADITHYFSEALGFGVKYSDAHSSGSIQGSVTFADGSSRRGTISDVVDIRFAGPFVSYRWVTPNARNAFYLSYGLGYLGIVDQSVVTTERLTSKGGTMGQMSDFGYDYSITKNLAIGASVSFIAGTLSSYTVYNSAEASQNVQLDKDDYQSLSHLTFSVGLRFLL